MPYTGRSVVEIIAAKRDGSTLSDDEIRWVIASYSEGALPHEQMAALAMAIYFKGLDPRESAAWTQAMLHSGRILDLSTLGPGRVDKHSTGGVGDKVSLVLAPMVAACGVTVPMVSGRGLGHTGGTIDKLESIGGYEAELGIERFIEILGEVGCAIIGQTGDIAPADKRLYALRDVTATVPSLPLIISSIMSKKLAEDIEGLVLDVKVGRGAWMKTVDDARELAQGMIAVGQQMGVRVIAFLTRMEAPLGRAVGNACEVREAIDILQGRGPEQLTGLITTLGGAMVEIGAGVDRDEGIRRVSTALADGSAWERFQRMVAAQGGDLDAIAGACGESTVTAQRGGFVSAIDGLEVGRVSVLLGAGRQHSDDAIDHGVGIRVDRLVGQKVEAGDTLATVLHGASGDPDPQLLARLVNAFVIEDFAPPEASLVIERIG